MTRVMAGAGSEIRIAMRNRWVAIAVAMMALFALVLSAAGSAPTGQIGADKLSVTVASLTSLAVYLVPLLALLMSFVTVAGEILAGKFLAHLAVLGIALLAGYGVAAVAAFAFDPGAPAGLPALVRLLLSSLLLGAAFLGAGYAVSAVSRRPGAAAGAAIGLWLVFVVLYDLGLLAAVVADGGGPFTTRVFPWLLLANPADAFRLYNLAASEAAGAAAGVAGAAQTIPPALALSSLLVWAAGGFALALLAFRRVRP